MKEVSEQIGHLTEDELQYIGIQSSKDAKPKELAKMGVLRREFLLKCPGGSNVIVTKFYTNERESPFVLQIKLPEH